MIALLLAQAEPITTSKLWMALITFATTASVLLITKLFEAWVKNKEHNAALKAKELEIEAEQRTRALDAEIERLAKEQEWKRQDEIAKRVQETANQAADAARLLLERQALDSLKTAEAARLLLAANERVAANSEVMNDKLDDIHTWTNAKMTESMQSELDSKEIALALLLEIVDLRKSSGQVPSSETLGRVKSMSARIAELKERIAERLKQQAIIDSKPVRSKTTVTQPTNPK